MININAERFLEDLKRQGQIGWKEGEGLYREGYTESYNKVRDFVKKKMEEAGLETRIDSVGNLFGRLEGTDPNAKTILTGSHLDSVTAGGILDGALGVIAALEALRTIKESGKKLKHSLEAVGFIAEEGGPLGGTFGSRAFSGQVKSLPPQDALKAVGLTKEDIEAAKADPNKYGAYLELHVEQGPVLWRKGLSVGIPTAIVGITRYMCTVKGVSNHAGTTPMEERKDAMYDAAVIIHKWLEYMRNQKGVVCNVGYIEVEPGHPCIVPGEVKFSVEIRSDQEEKIKDAEDKLKQIISQVNDCNAVAELFIQKPPVKLSEKIIETIEEVSKDLEIEAPRMPSWASHDASPIAHVIPTGMIFVPSINGISHQKDEFTEDEDMVRGVNVLTNAIIKLDEILD